VAHPDELAPLIRLVASKLGTDADHSAIDEALSALSTDADLVVRFERAVEWIGVRVRWVACEGVDLSAIARPDLPLVGIDPERGSWWIVDRSWMGKVRTISAMWADARWVDPSELPTSSPVVWARVEPLLPAAPWASGQGAPLSPTQRVVGLLRSEHRDVTVVLVYAVLVGVLTLATPLATQVLINQLAFGVVLQPILFLGLALLMCLTLAAGLCLIAPTSTCRTGFHRDVAHRIATGSTGEDGGTKSWPQATRTSGNGRKGGGAAERARDEVRHWNGDECACCGLSHLPSLVALVCSFLGDPMAPRLSGLAMRRSDRADAMAVRDRTPSCTIAPDSPPTRAWRQRAARGRRPPAMDIHFGRSLSNRQRVVRLSRARPGPGRESHLRCMGVS